MKIHLEISLCYKCSGEIFQSHFSISLSSTRIKFKMQVSCCLLLSDKLIFPWDFWGPGFMQISQQMLYLNRPLPLSPVPQTLCSHQSGISRSPEFFRNFRANPALVLTLPLRIPALTSFQALIVLLAPCQPATHFKYFFQ